MQFKNLTFIIFLFAPLVLLSQTKRKKELWEYPTNYPLLIYTEITQSLLNPLLFSPSYSLNIQTYWRILPKIYLGLGTGTANLINKESIKSILRQNVKLDITRLGKAKNKLELGIRAYPVFNLIEKYNWAENIYLEASYLQYKYTGSTELKVINDSLSTASKIEDYSLENLAMTRSIINCKVGYSINKDKQRENWEDKKKVIPTTDFYFNFCYVNLLNLKQMYTTTNNTALPYKPYTENFVQYSIGVNIGLGICNKRFR